MTRFLGVFIAVFLLAGSAGANNRSGLPAPDLSAPDLSAPDLSAYVVNDPDAGYFDRQRRRQYLLTTTDPLLRDLVERARLGLSCRKAMSIEPIVGPYKLPSFHRENSAWRTAVMPFVAFENIVNELAAAQLVADDRYHADCLLDLLLTWAERDALSGFVVEGADKQAWFQLEGTLIAMALSLAIARPDIADRSDELSTVEAWLTRLAKRHLSIPPGEGSCCNNHMYRRGAYAAMIGVLTADDSLFQFGVEALFHAMADATESGALPLEMERGVLAVHYQNFSAIYLALIAQIAERQGYPAFDLEHAGMPLKRILEFAVAARVDPDLVNDLSGAETQNLRFAQDNQYYSWLEIIPDRYEDASFAQGLDRMRPIYNRTSGGFATLFFHRPHP